MDRVRPAGPAVLGMDLYAPTLSCTARTASPASSAGVVESTSSAWAGEPSTLTTRPSRATFTRRSLTAAGIPSYDCAQRTSLTPPGDVVVSGADSVSRSAVVSPRSDRCERTNASAICSGEPGAGPVSVPSSLASTRGVPVAGSTSTTACGPSCFFSPARSARTVAGRAPCVASTYGLSSAWAVAGAASASSMSAAGALQDPMARGYWTPGRRAPGHALRFHCTCLATSS